MITAVRELSHSRDLFVTLVQREVKLRAKRSWMSMVWPVVMPFVMMALYVFVFKRVFNVPIERYPEYLLCGLLPWVFLAQTLSKATASISLESDLIRKAPFPYELMPMSTVAAQAVNFLLTLSIFVALLGVLGDLHYAVLPALVFPVLALALLVTSLAIVLSLVDVYNHDLRHILGNVLTIWFFLVPIVYRPTMVPSGVEFVQGIDPVNLIVNQFRSVLYRGQVGDFGDMFLMFATCILVFVVCLTAFRRYSVNLPKDI